MQLGTVISGTCKVDDLLKAFADELGEDHRLWDDAMFLVKALRDDRDVVYEANDVLEELVEELGRRSPEGVYFGTHPGDGADWGYWSEEEVV